MRILFTVLGNSRRSNYLDGESCMVLPGDITETAKEFFDFETK